MYLQNSIPAIWLVLVAILFVSPGAYGTARSLLKQRSVSRKKLIEMLTTSLPLALM